MAYEDIDKFQPKAADIQPQPMEAALREIAKHVMTSHVLDWKEALSTPRNKTTMSIAMVAAGRFCRDEA